MDGQQQDNKQLDSKLVFVQTNIALPQPGLALKFLGALIPKSDLEKTIQGLQVQNNNMVWMINEYKKEGGIK